MEEKQVNAAGDYASRRPTARLRLLINCPVLHNEPHLSQRRNILCRVAFDRDEVGKQTIFYLADAIAYLQCLCIYRGRRPECIYQRHSKTYHRLDLTRIVAVGKHTNVAAACDRDTGL